LHFSKQAPTLGDMSDDKTDKPGQAPNHGGKRSGAGRPKVKPERSAVTIRISEEARGVLGQLTQNQSQSDAVEKVLEGLSAAQIEKFSKVA